MAIAFDAAATKQDNAVTTQTISHTISGSNTLLLVGFITNNNTDIITKVTWNGTGMTRLTYQAGSGGYLSYVYYLVGAATGTANVVISASSNSLLWTSVTSYNGVKQTGFPDAQASSQNGSTSWTASLTTVADNAWHYLHIRGSSPITFSTGTERANASQGDAGDKGPKTPAGSDSITGTLGGSANDSTFIQVSFAPATAVANSGFFNFM